MKQLTSGGYSRIKNEDRKRRKMGWKETLWGETKEHIAGNVSAQNWRSERKRGRGGGIARWTVGEAQWVPCSSRISFPVQAAGGRQGWEQVQVTVFSISRCPEKRRGKVYFRCHGKTRTFLPTHGCQLGDFWLEHSFLCVPEYVTGCWDLHGCVKYMHR